MHVTVVSPSPFLRATRHCVCAFLKHRAARRTECAVPTLFPPPQSASREIDLGRCTASTSPGARRATRPRMPTWTWRGSWSGWRRRR
eukprot:11131831-Lingulodinium_polyedra.AAC.1